MTNPNAWLTKLAIEVTEDDNSPCLMKIDWDEADPELDYWSNLSQEGKETLIHNLLNPDGTHHDH